MVGAEAVTVVKLTQNIYRAYTPTNCDKVKQPDKMTARELRQEIKEIQSVEDISRFAVQYYMKFAISCLFSVCLDWRAWYAASEKEYVIHFLLSIVIIFIYYIVLTISSTLGQR